jgi:hypothetical protein
MRAQFIELAQEEIKLRGRHGASGSRLLEPLVAEAADVYVLSSEFDDAERHGVFIDSLHEDADFESFTARASAADGPWRTVSRLLASDVPLGVDGPSERGVIVSAYIRRAVPSRLAEACEVMARLYGFLIDHGGTNCRLCVLDVAGGWSGALLGCWEADSMATRGRVLDAFGSKPEGQALAGIFASAGAPVSLLWSSLYRDLGL